MKDERIEKQFDEYFEGINTPDNIMADAKKLVRKKSSFSSAFVKFASIAASVVLTLSVSLAIVFATRSAAPEIPAVSVYGNGEISFEQTDVYEITKIDNSLRFIKYLANNGASVNSCSAGYMDGELALVKADVSLISGITRHDTEIYVEFTEADTVYSPLKNYYDGEKGTYRGTEYYLTREVAENGEPVNKLQVSYNSVKYYFYVTSSDENAYLKYLQAILN